MKFAFGNGDKPLDGYTIKRGIGVGGFGEVYFAVNDAGKEVALKRIQRNLDVEVRGVRQCINLRHPNLVGLYDIRFDDSDQGWIVMEYVAGHSLRDMLDHQGGGFEVDRALQLFGQIAAGVTYLHDQGIVHRDLKPANIFSDNGLMKIGDYGLSKFISSSRRGGQTESVGTFHYMAPEIGKGEYGKEIDIYALGIILYEILTGTVPFDGESGQEIILKHLTADPDVRGLPDPFASVIMKALAKSPSARFRDVRELLSPLGLAIDSSGLVVKVASLPGAAPMAIQDGPPVLQPLPLFGAVTTDGRPGSAPQAPKGAGSHPYRKEPNPASAKKAAAEVTTLLYREPLARAVQQGWLSMQEQWNRLPMNSSTRNIVVAALALIIIFNAPVMVSLFVSAMVFYFPYYVIWYLVTGGNNPNKGKPSQTVVSSPMAAVAPAAAPLNPQPGMAPPRAPIPAAPVPRPVAVPKPQPLTIRQWQAAQRHKLAAKTFSTRWHEASGSMISSTYILGILGVIGGLVALGSNRHEQPGFLAAAVWTGAMSLIGCWTVLFLGKRWEAREEDRANFRFKQLAAGLGLGGVGYALSQFLMVPWTDVSKDAVIQGIQHWNGFYDSRENPLLPAFLSYFALLMGGVRWWRHADIVRKSRFSLIPIVGAVSIAGLVQLLIPFPQPWSLLVAGCMAFTLQLSSPWIDPSQRLQPNPESKMV